MRFSRSLRVRTIFATAALFALFCSPPSYAATRGEVINTIIAALDLPEWSGGRHYADLGPDHPFSKSIETAAALGILHPTEQFYPDIEASRAEALMFALQAMGLRHEASLMEKLAPQARPELPLYISPYLSLAKDLQPSPPAEFLLNPCGAVSRQDLFTLGSWLRECKRELLWHREITAGDSTLVLIRENIGAPPPEWAVLSSELESEEEAADLAGRLRNLGYPAMTQPMEWSWLIRIGPFSHYFDAWETMMKIPVPGMTVAPFSQKPGRALFIAALGFDPAVRPPRIVTASSISGRRLPLDLIAENSGAEGAVNGGFFSGAKIVGSLIIRSRPVSSSYGDRSAVGWSADGSRIHFGRGDFRTIITIGDMDYPVSTINSVPPQGGVGIFTPDVWTYVTGAPADGWELTVKNGLAAGGRPAAASNHFVTREGFLVISRGYPSRSMQQIQEGAAVSVRTEWMEQNFRGLDYILQAGPMLVKEGVPGYSSEGFGPRTLAAPHPRSLIGFDGEKIWFVVIDGRDPWHSNGLTMDGTARAARKMGLLYALNLDGGGSSSIWWRGHIVTSPPGGVIRPVPYALVF